MTFEEFQQQFHISLTEQQLTAVSRVEGPTLLLAVPGSGKTTVLVTRLGYMIFCREIPPENILTLTYTVAATKDMADRFCRLFGEDLRNRLEFRTINGICARILYYYGKCIGKETYPLLSKEEERKGILSLIYRQIMKDYATEGELQEIGARITYIKNMMMSEEELDTYNNDCTLPIKEIYRTYNAELKNQKRIDFDDQMIYAWKILKSVPQVRTVFQRKYQYICVDEAQDTSKIQHAIIALLAADNENLFMVGDEDQSIYGFRAAYPQALLDFEKNHPQAQVLLMEKNFRSDAAIVSAADAFIRKNTLRHPKNMKAARPESAEISQIKIRTRKAQHAWLSQMAASLYKDDPEDGTNTEHSRKNTFTAILYRDNESAIPLIDLLERDSIPYNIRNADLSFFTHRTVTDIRNILHFARYPQDTECFLKIYYKLQLYMNKASAEKAVRLSEEHNLPVLDAVLRYGRMPVYVQEHCRDIRQNLSALRHDGARDALNRIVDQMGYAEYLTRSSISDRKIYTLRTIAAREEKPEDLLHRLDQLQNLIRMKEYDPSARLILSTIHGSKGLEYDTVYLLDVCDGVFPESVPQKRKKLTGSELETWEEERRLFYVGVTRARNRLCLFHIENEATTFVTEFFNAYKTLQQKKVPVGTEKGKRKDKSLPYNNLLKEPVKENVRKEQKVDTMPEQASAADIWKKSSVADSPENSSEEEFLKFCQELGEGLIVNHKKFGQGVITGMTDRTVTVSFEDGEKTMGLRILFQKKLLTI